MKNLQQQYGAMPSFFLILVMLVDTSAFADNMPRPAEVLERAGRSRAEFMEVTGDVERLAPKAGAREDLYPYVFILEKLQTIAKKYNFDELGINPVGQLAAVLTKNMVKWVKFDTDDETFLNQFFYWADNNTRYAAIYSQGKFIALTTDGAELLKWQEITMKILKVAENVKSDPFVIQGVEDLQGASTRKLLEMRNQLDEPTLLRVIRQTTSVPGIQEVLTYLQQEVMTTQDSVRLKKIITWAIEIAGNVRIVSGTVPFHIRSNPGQIVIEGISRVLSKGGTFDINDGDSLIASLLPNQIFDLGALILEMFENRPVSAQQIDFVYDFSTRLLKRYAALDGGPRSKVLAKFVQKTALQRVATQVKLEGTYRVQIGEHGGVLVIADLGNSQFVAGVSTPTAEDFDYSFFHIAYNSKTGMFEASHFPVDETSHTHSISDVFWLKFNVKHQANYNTIEGIFTDRLGGHRMFGHKVGEFPNFKNLVSKDTNPPSTVSGSYRGTACGNAVSLTLNQEGPRVSGLLTFESPPVRMLDLTTGYFDPAQGLLYVTSGELTNLRPVPLINGVVEDKPDPELSEFNRRWIQIRGRFANGGREFKGVYLLSSLGKACDLFLMKSH